MTTDPLTELEAALAAAHPDSLTCPTCGSLVRVVSSDEGTSYYQPIAEVRALREALLAVLDSDALDPDEFLSLAKMCHRALGRDWPYLEPALDRPDR